MPARTTPRAPATAISPARRLVRAGENRCISTLVTSARKTRRVSATFVLPCSPGSIPGMGTWSTNASGSTERRSPSRLVRATPVTWAWRGWPSAASCAYPFAGNRVAGNGLECRAPKTRQKSKADGRRWPVHACVGTVGTKGDHETAPRLLDDTPLGTPLWDASGRLATPWGRLRGTPRDASPRFLGPHAAKSAGVRLQSSGQLRGNPIIPRQPLIPRQPFCRPSASVHCRLPLVWPALV